MIKNRSGFLLAGFLAVDTRLMIILASGVQGTILFTIMAIKGRPIIPIDTQITILQPVPGIHTAIPTGIHTIITVIIGGIGKPCWKNIIVFNATFFLNPCSVDYLFIIYKNNN